MKRFWIAVARGFSLFLVVDALLCYDNEAGLCEVSSLHGWCYVNLTSGVYNCDSDEYCSSKKDSFKGNKAGGCFKDKTTNEQSDCCCSDRDICNQKHMTFYNASNTQMCADSVGNGCRDAWCYSIFVTRDGSSTTMKGCYSTLRFMLRETAVEDEKSALPAIKAISDVSTCSALVATKSQEGREGEACQEVETEVNGKPVFGRFCCCNSGHECNEAILDRQGPKRTEGTFELELDSGASSVIATIISIAVAQIFLAIQ